MSHKTSFWATLPGCLVLILIALLGYSVGRDHSSHLVQWAPFLIILLCPLMHVFMHRGHNHSQQDSEIESKHDAEQSNPKSH